MSNREYIVHLDNGVRLVISLAENRPGPGVQPSLLGNDQYGYFRVQLPGGVVAISAPSVSAEGVNWSTVAKGFGAKLILPISEPEPEKPTPEPYEQEGIPL